MKKCYGTFRRKGENKFIPTSTYIVSSTITGITDIIPWYVLYKKFCNMQVVKIKIQWVYYYKMMRVYTHDESEWDDKRTKR